MDDIDEYLEKRLGYSKSTDRYHHHVGPVYDYAGQKRGKQTPIVRVVAAIKSARRRHFSKWPDEPFISLSDLLPLPSKCPVFGTQLRYGGNCNTNQSPSLDRIDNTRGYSPGNVRIISARANRMKSDSSIDDMERILAYMKNGDI